MKITVQQKPPAPPPPKRYLLDCSEDEAQAIYAFVSGIQTGSSDLFEPNKRPDMYEQLKNVFGYPSKFELADGDGKSFRGRMHPRLILYSKP